MDLIDKIARIDDLNQQEVDSLMAELRFIERNRELIIDELNRLNSLRRARCIEVAESFLPLPETKFENDRLQWTEEEGENEFAVFTIHRFRNGGRYVLGKESRHGCSSLFSGSLGQLKRFLTQHNAKKDAQKKS